MPKVIISYRRADSDAIAGRIRDRLAAHFGDDSIYMDIDSIPFGTDFRDHIRNALFDSDVLVAVVGPKWLGPGKGAHLRIKEENDPIRIEVETALDRDIAVIPVLVNGALMPKPSELPAALENFAFRNAAEIDSGRDFHPHMDRLIKSIDRILQAKGKQPTVSGTVGGSPVTAGSVEPRPVEAHEAAPEVVKHEPAPASPVPAAAAAALVGSPGVTEASGSPTGTPKRGGAVIALAAGGGMAIAAAIAGIVIWFYGRPAVTSDPQPKVIAQPQPQPQSPPQPPTAVAAGCPGTPAFHDDFKTVDPGWVLGDNASYADGQLAIKAPPDTGTSVIYRSLLYKNATICLDVKTPPAIQGSDGGGLVFWAADYSNYYLAKVTADGRYRISRRANDTWLTVTPLIAFDGLKQGYGVVNRIKVSTAGNVATVYLNDRKALDIKGQPPRSGGSVGMYGESEKGQANEWRFLDIAVVELPASETITVPPSEAATKAMLTACKLGPNAAFADDFKVSDPSWNGVNDQTAYYANGHLVIKPMENSIARVLNLSLIYKDITICGILTSPTQIKAENDTAGGVAFWASDGSNLYQAVVYPDGSYSIARRVDNKLLSVVAKTSFDAVNKGPGAQNRLKIVLNNTLGTLYINDVKVREFRGQPPANGSSFGLYVESETGQRTEWGVTGIVVAEP